MSVTKSDDSKGEEEDPNRLSPRMAIPTRPRLTLIKKSLEQNELSKLSKMDSQADTRSVGTGGNSTKMLAKHNEEINQMQQEVDQTLSQLNKA